MQPDHAMGAVAALIEHNLYSPEVREELLDMMDEDDPIQPDGDPAKYNEIQAMLHQMTVSRMRGSPQQKSMSVVDSFLVPENHMPLKPGKQNVGANINELVHSGKPQKQAVAIAMKEAKKRKKRKGHEKFEALSQILQKSCLDFSKHRP